jgi:hypothetical protein
MRPPLERPVEDGPDASRTLGQKLRVLPTERTPPFDWAELQRRARERRASRSRTLEGRTALRHPLVLAAALASIVAAALLTDHLLSSGRAGGPVDRGASAHSSVAQVPVDQTLLENRASRDPDPLLRRAAAAERWLASQPDDQPIVRVSTHLAVSDLEDRIASVDDLLNVERLRNAHARVHALQLERAQLVDSLAQVRYAEILTTDPP